MKNNDKYTKEEVRGMMLQALSDDDSEKFSEAFNLMLECLGDEIKSDYDQEFAEFKESIDTQILTARGVRQLTLEEKEYYQKLSDAMRSADPRQAITNIEPTMPKTIINSVFEDLRLQHPLLSAITFTPTEGITEMVTSEDGYQKASWGKLTGAIVEELAGGFKVVDTSLFKLSAFLPISKAMLDLGPEYLDRYIREILYEAMSNGLEYGIVSGTGKDMPIGMTRQVGDDVTVTGGVYPEKEKISVNDLSASTVGNLLSLLAVAPNGKNRPVRDVILIVNPQDYLQKVMPATTLMAPDGTYRNDVMPFPMSIIQSAALNRGQAVIGLARKYFCGAGSDKDGKIEYSDEYKFLEDERVYLIKLYANGFALDDNAFLLLDISNLEPLAWKVEQVEASTKSSDAALASLKIGGLTLSPAFSSATATYTATTTNATNAITAVPANAAATIEVKVGSTVISNGASATWTDGANTVKVLVTAEDGTEKTYTVTVTKS